MRTLLEIVTKALEFLASKGIANAKVNAELLIGHALHLKRRELYSQLERPLTEGELETIRSLLRRRGQREPLQYIMGHTEFCGLKIITDRRALIPRPRTELLVERITELLAEKPPTSILDLGTGCGAIALALATHWPLAKVTATDIDSKALTLAEENAISLGIVGRMIFIQSDWFMTLGANARFDLIVANPPYLSEEETAALDIEVRQHEPEIALTAGPSGHEAIFKIIADSVRYLKPGGWLAMETGEAQHAGIMEKLNFLGFSLGDLRPVLRGQNSSVLAQSAH